MKKQISFYPKIQSFVDKAKTEAELIPEVRRKELTAFAQYISEQNARSKTVSLLFICTHNSRRSHMSQIWGQAISRYYGLNNITTYSGGTEATAFNARAVKAMADFGFAINRIKNGTNPIYEVRFSNESDSLKVFSKVFNAESNPTTDFCAIMTCSHADENCPVVGGAVKRITLTYDDPKDFDNTPLESFKYTERVQQIGRELIYAFKQVK